MTSGPRLPTRAIDWRRTAALAGRVVSSPVYVALAFVVGILTVVVFVAARNLRLVLDVVLFGSQSLAIRLSVLANLLPVVGSGLDPVSELLLLVLSVLSGVTFAAVVFRIRRERATAAAGTGTVGILLGSAGVGCAACGAPLLAAILGTAGAGAVSALPFGGTEFAVPAIGLLVLSLFWVADDLDADTVCELDGRNERE